MGLEKINSDIEMDLNLKIFERFFFVWFFHLKCYDTAICGGKKL